MRIGFLGLLILTTVFAGGYWFYIAEAVCGAPIGYRIGIIDQNFKLSYEEARTVVSDAESLWEDATGRNLFTYDPESDFAINFVFDDRQAYFNAKKNLYGELENREELSDEVRAEYESFIEQYEDLKNGYEAQLAAYQVKFDAHQTEVTKWNERGGAPKDVFNELKESEEELNQQRNELNSVAGRLDVLVDAINEIGEQGNVLVSAYNNVVEVYNDRFNESRDFTQGDYQGDRINIYQYSDFEELRIVIAHEFGHSLLLDHVENEESIMYNFMGAQDLEKGLTATDITEFQRVCGNETFTLWSIL